MWKGIAFLNNIHDEKRLRKNYRQSKLSGWEVVPFKNQYYLTDYIMGVIKQLDERPEFVYKELDKRVKDEIQRLEKQIHEHTGSKKELIKLEHKLKRLEGYNPLRDTKDFRIYRY